MNSNGLTGPDVSAGLRVLVVEDDAGFASHLALLLGRRGHKVRIASDGAAALEAGPRRDRPRHAQGSPAHSGHR
jgi:ActR/RegA family two-component response regulator